MKSVNCLFFAILFVATAGAGDVFETRAHFKVDAPATTSAYRAGVSQGTEGTRIVRQHLKEGVTIARGLKPTADQVVWVERISLIRLANAMDATLKVSSQAKGQSVTLELKAKGKDLETISLQMPSKGAMKGGEAAASVTASARGQKWTMPLADWQSGKISSEERAKLGFDADTLRRLNEVGMIARRYLNDKAVLELMWVPLSGQELPEGLPPVTDLADINLNELDCGFDLQFSHPCTQTQQAQYEAKKMGGVPGPSKR